MSKSDFHTIRKLKLQVRVLVFSVLNVSELNYTRVDTWKKLEETWRVHVNVRLLSQDYTFDLFNFFPKFFPKFELPLIRWCLWYVCLYLPLYCCRINLLKQMSHNNVTMICTFGFRYFICSVRVLISVFCLLLHQLKRKATVLHLYLLTLARRLFLARQAIREIFFMNYMPFSFMKPSSMITLSGADTGNSERRGRFPHSPPLMKTEHFTLFPL